MAASPYALSSYAQNMPLPPGMDPNDPNNIDPYTGLPVQQSMAQQGGGPQPGGGAYPNAPSPYTPNLPNGSDPSNLPSGDPNVLQRNAISTTLGEGNNLIGAAGQQQGVYGNRETAGYDQFQKQYAPIWNGGGGYTPGEQSGILQSGGPTGTDALQYEASQGLNNDFLSPADQKNMVGDPYRAQRTSQADTAKLTAGSADEATKQRNINTGGAADLAGDVSTMAAGYKAAIDPAQLGVSAGYGQGQAAALGQGQASTSAALANPDLNVTDQYKQQAGMTDQEVANTAALGAEAAGAGYAADEDALQQAAEASGETNPLAVAAMRDTLQREKGAAVTDATVKAQLEARGQQRAAAQGVQTTELGAGQYKTGAELNTAQQLMQAQIASGQAQENTRLGAAQDISGRQMTAAGDVGLAAIGTGEFGQGQAAGTEANIAARQSQEGEYSQTQDVGTAAQGEADAQARQAQLALNNQQTKQYNQATQFGQSYATNQALSNRYSSIANQHQQQQAEGRTAAGQQEQYQGSQANAAGTRQENAYNTQTAGVGAETGAYATDKQNSANNSFFGSNGLFGGMVKAGMSGAASVAASPYGSFAEGTILDRPTHLQMADGSDAIAGEAGTEAIVPLNDPYFEPMMRKVQQARMALKRQSTPYLHERAA